MIKDYNVPLDVKQCRQIREAMNSSSSLAEITREATVYRVVKYLMEDKPSFELYLTNMAGWLTNQRQQISYRALIKSIFHTTKSLTHYNKEFQTLLINIIDGEREIQQRVFIAENHLQTNVHNNIWKMYGKYGDTLRLNSLDFSLVHCKSLRYELKYYHIYLFERVGKAAVSLFHSQTIALNALTEIDSRIKYFADITEADARAMLLLLENTCRKNRNVPMSQNYIALAVNGLRRVIEYLMSDMRDTEIRAPRPYMNPFANFSFHNMTEYVTPTPVIPEDIVEQISKYSEELPSLFKLLYDIFINTGLRLKEVFLLKTDCVETSRYPGIYQLKFTPYKTIAARRRHNAGDFHRVMIAQSLADEITSYINGSVSLKGTISPSYIFLSQKPKHTAAVMDSKPFIMSIRNIITKHDIRDENGELWHFTSKQFRKTVAVTLIENGATTTELAYWLGHMSSGTAAKYYSEVRKMKLAELNTRFLMEKFNLIVSGEQLEQYTEKERKLLYTDFRLEQRRVELGYCLIKAADGKCPNRNSLYNCVNCTNLCTGTKYLAYWSDLLNQQEATLDSLVQAYHTDGIEDYDDFAAYKQELRLLKGYRNIVAAIKEGGISHA